MNDPRLMSVNEKLNRYFTLIKTENPNMSERDILERAATMAMKEQKEFEAKAQLDVNDISIIDRFGDGTRITTAADGTPIVRVDHAWQQSIGSKISSDGFTSTDVKFTCFLSTLINSFNFLYSTNLLLFS